MNLNQLLHKARNGTNADEDELFRYISERFHRFVQQRVQSLEDSEEIVQDTMISIAQQYKSIEIHTDFGAWAYGILENKLRYYYRTKKNYKTKMSNFAEIERSHPPREINPDLKRLLLECLKKINETNLKYIRILNLYCQGYTTKEICQKLKITENNCYVIFSRARSLLKKCIQEGNNK